MRKIKFKTGEHYHLFNRGVDRRTIFGSKEDYDRFEGYLYLLNDAESPRAANFFSGGRQKELFTSARGEQLVAIGAYCLLQDHFHILATPLVDNGISRFMLKLQTAYTMYFNDKYGRTGSLFAGTYKAHVAEPGAHLKYVFAEIHLSAAAIFDPNWREASDDALERLARKSMQYRYSSMGEYATSSPVITTPKKFPKYFREAKDAQAYVEPWLKSRFKFEEKSYK